MLEAHHIYHGADNAISLRLQATNVDTGVTAPLSTDQTANITQIKVALAAGAGSVPVVLDSASLNTGEETPIDWATRLAESVVTLALGSVSAVTLPPRKYFECWMEVTFSNVAHPVRFPFPKQLLSMEDSPRDQY